MSHVQLFLDWDGTLTRHDTILALTRIGYNSVMAGEGPQYPGWEPIVQRYLQDLKAHNSTYQPAKESRTTTEQESMYLESLKPIEVASIARVNKSKVLDFIDRGSVRAGIEKAFENNEVEMRDGWETLFEHIDSNWWDEHILDTAILTVNWSANFIRHCLNIAAVDGTLLEVNIGNNLKVFGNEVTQYFSAVTRDRCPGLDGPPEKLINTSADKLAVFKKVTVEGQKKAAETGKKFNSFYVGDTCTDFDCLLAADVGVCVRDEPLRGGQQELAETFARVGVAVLPLKDLQSSAQGDDRTRVVYWSADLRAIAEALNKLRGI